MQSLQVTGRNEQIGTAPDFCGGCVPLFGKVWCGSLAIPHGTLSLIHICNMLGGTELIRRKLGKDDYAMTITLLLNSEGKKMGKTASDVYKRQVFHRAR